MKTLSTRFAAALLAAVLLAACGGQTEQAGQAAGQEEGGAFRREFAAAFTQSCLKSLPREAGLTETQARQICGCSAEKAADMVTPADTAKLVKGDAEITARALEAAKACKSEVLGTGAASGGK